MSPIFSVYQQPVSFVHVVLKLAGVKVKVLMREAETGSLNVRFGRGRKPVSTESNRESCTLGGRGQSASNVQASASVRLEAEALDLPRSTVQKIMRKFSVTIHASFNLCRNCFHIFRDTTSVLTAVSCSFEVGSRMALEYPLDRRSTLSFTGSVNTHN
ncbi:hypothetical protein TNCV_3742891 [Trichonephila clavipes]|nr:hypothetical protein TNCV_3742891 [Trichonephila clavipes]